MVYKSTNIDRVISKILRDTRVSSSDYIGDFYEWIPEAMSLMETKQPLAPNHIDLTTQFHMAKLPIGLRFITAVEYMGTRLRRVESARQFGTGTPSLPVDPTFRTVVTIRDTPTGPVTDLGVVASYPENTSVTYSIILDHISTSLDNITVRVHYREVPHDERGFPLIPDNQNYKEALYYYVRDKMVGSGYEDPVYGKDPRLLHEMFEKYANRAIQEITYPSPEDMERMTDQIRFIPDANFYDNFYTTDGGGF